MRHWMTNARCIAALLYVLHVPAYAQAPAKQAPTFKSVVSTLDETITPADLKGVQYHVPTLEKMVDFMFAYGYIDPNDPQQLIDYVRIKDCKLFNRHYNDDFTWNKIKNRIISEATSLQKDVPTHFVVSDIYEIDRYNFKSKAFDITDNNRLKGIDSLNIIDERGSDTCDSKRSFYGKQAIPVIFDLKLQTPVSLYRIPMSEAMARYILPELSSVTSSGAEKRNVYALIYFTVDGVMGTAGANALLSGRVDKMEFFLDPQRTQRFKRLVFNLD